MRVATTSISVAVATYNGERFVREQLRSILTQTHPPEQVIVSDDGSTDATLSVVEEIAGSAAIPILIRRNRTRLGVTANFEAALRGANGELVALADQDDVWLPTKLEVMQSVFAQSQVGAAFSDAVVIDDSSHPTGRTLWERFGMTAHERRLILSGRMFPVQLRWNFVTGATMCVRRELLDTLLPFPDRGMHDQWIAVIAGGLGVLRPIAEPLMQYRVHGANVAGVPPRGVRAGLLQREADNEQHERELSMYTAAHDRLGAGGAAPDALARIEGKLAHLRARAELPDSPLRRAWAVATMAASGGYARYSKRAARSIAYDMLRGGSSARF